MSRQLKFCLGALRVINTKGGCGLRRPEKLSVRFGRKVECEDIAGLQALRPSNREPLSKERQRKGAIASKCSLACRPRPSTAQNVLLYMGRPPARAGEQHVSSAARGRAYPWRGQECVSRARCTRGCFPYRSGSPANTRSRRCPRPRPGPNPGAGA